ncbi:dihydroneopterin aldolase [Moorella sulfitireducens (nom. illeg.)]|uniref:dihydroneopterin aldolase n=1 Tax=Neomoorella sulfitireducens TaxID=2972948 RepID=UPI0021AC0AD1|nr:dihydroneopterin aldolase [Moorella sulfitireducens]
MAKDKIILDGLAFYAYHGCQPAEAELGQPFIVDVELYLDLAPAGQADDLQATVNYDTVYQLIREIVTGQRYKLLEALAESVAQKILTCFPVEEVLVRVKKPRAPLPGTFNYAAVEIRRSRKGP